MATGKKKTIVFVCTGNTCRSPMAEASMRRFLSEKGENGFFVTSAGISPNGNERELSLYSSRALSFRGMKLDGFTAKAFDDGLLKTATLIVCMTEKHKAYLVERKKELFPTARKKNLYSFEDVCGFSVPDPYGGTQEDYDDTLDKIESGLERIYALLKKLTEPKRKIETKRTQTLEKSSCVCYNSSKKKGAKK